MTVHGGTIALEHQLQGLRFYRRPFFSSAGGFGRRLIFSLGALNQCPQFGCGVGHIDMLNSQRRESVRHCVGDRWRRAVGAAFADTFDAEGVKRIGRDGFP